MNELHGEVPAWSAASGAWSEREDEALLAGFRVGCSLDELAGRHRRAVHDIQARLVVLGQIERTAQT